MKQEALAALAAMLFGFAAPAALSQAFPSHPVKIVVPAAAGGIGDVFVRKLSDAMSKGLGQPEAGLPAFDLAAWSGFLAPAGTPPEIVARLNQDLVSALKQPQFLEWVAGNGSEAYRPRPSSSRPTSRPSSSSGRRSSRMRKS